MAAPESLAILDYIFELSIIRLLTYKANNAPELCISFCFNYILFMIHLSNFPRLIA